MKKFVSMAMVAAMTVSMVPATAFAADDIDATAKVVNKWTRKDTAGTTVSNSPKSAPELQIKITDVATQGTDNTQTFEYTVALDGADFDLDGDGVLEQAEIDTLNAGITVELAKDGTVDATPETSTFAYALVDTGAANEYLEEIYEHLKEIGAGVPTELPEGLEELVYSTSDISTATTEQDKLTLDAFNTAFTSLSTPVTGESTITGTDVVDAVLNAYGADNIASFTSLNGTYDSYEEAELVDSNGDTQVGFNIIDDASNKQFVKKSAVLAWAENNDFEDHLADDDFADSVTTPTQTFAQWLALSAQDTLRTDFVDANLYEETVTGNGDGVAGSGAGRVDISAAITGWEADELEEVTITIDCGTNGETLAVGDIIKMDLVSELDKMKDAFVSVTSDDINISNDSEDMIYVDIEDEGITASIKKLGTVAEEEKAFLEKNLKLESVVGDFVDGQVIELKLNSGFEFANVGSGDSTYSLDKTDDDIVEVTVIGDRDEIEIAAEDLQIEAVSAKSGAVATLKVKAKNNVTGGFNATTSVEVMKVVDYTVIMSVEEDEDVPVIYSGVNVENDGITDDSDHMSLEVTIEESFPGAWSMRKGFELELPDGVYVTDVEVTDTDSLFVNGDGTGNNEVGATEVRDAFWNAYQEADHKGFEFEKRVFDDVDASLAEDEATMTFKLELVAEPGFVGDVTLGLKGDLVDEQEVTIAKFVTPFIVKAEQNDLKIDYRYTEVPTDIVITETEAGLWDADKAMFGFYIEKDLLTFEEDPTFTVNEESGMELDKAEIFEHYYVDTEEDYFDLVGFTLDRESDDEAAVVTISDLQLYMSRNIPAGPYDLKMASSLGKGFVEEVLFAADGTDVTVNVNALNDGKDAPQKPFAYTSNKDDEDYFVNDVADIDTTVKEAFVNVVTAGREQDDASFTTKVVVPVGEAYIVSGENTVELDVPAYISAAGYTMLPVRAVANALGINNNNVIWNGESKTVTILYGQRIITMVAGQKVINVNGSAIPASAAVEIVDGRTFLPMRDLATALGVTDITWDAATKTATLNGGVDAE